MASGIFVLLADFWLGAALCNKRFQLRRPRGADFSVVSRPAAGNSARHHHLDGAVGRCASGAAAGDRAVAAAALGARQSRRGAARPCRLPLCRSGPGAGGCRAIIFGFAILMAVWRRRSGQPGERTSWWLGPTLLAPRPSPLPPPSEVGRAAHPERAQPAPAQVINQLLDEDRSSGITTLIMTVFDTEAWGRLSGVDIGPRQPAAYTTVLDRFQCPSGSRRAVIKATGNASFLPH